MTIISAEIMGMKILYSSFTTERHWLEEEIGRSTWYNQVFLCCLSEYGAQGRSFSLLGPTTNWRS